MRIPLQSRLRGTDDRRLLARALSFVVVLGLLATWLPGDVSEENESRVVVTELEDGDAGELDCRVRSHRSGTHPRAYAQSVLVETVPWSDDHGPRGSRSEYFDPRQPRLGIDLTLFNAPKLCPPA